MTNILVNKTKKRIDEIYGVLKSSDRTFSHSDRANTGTSDQAFSLSDDNNVLNQELYFIRDYLGNIKSIFDNNGNMLYYRLYDEFGNEDDSGQAAQVSLNLGAAQTPAFGFTSREFDEIADLYFYRSRYYDPTLGRFTQRDKFNEAGFITGNPAVIYNPLQLNDYTYVGNNPLIYTDPWGEEPITLTIIGGAIVIGAISGAVFEMVNVYLENRGGADKSYFEGFVSGGLSGVLAGPATLINPLFGGVTGSLSKKLIYENLFNHNPLKGDESILDIVKSYDWDIAVGIVTGGLGYLKTDLFERIVITQVFYPIANFKEYLYGKEYCK